MGRGRALLGRRPKLIGPRTARHPTIRESGIIIHDVIRVRGARQNNLDGVDVDVDVDVDISKRKITIFTGVSGSGKSSLAFDTIAAESRRLLNKTHAAFVQSLLPSSGGLGRVPRRGASS
nr:hypothetical protein [Frankia sp. Cr1]